MSDQYEEAALKPTSIRLGNETVELEPDAAEKVRAAFEGLAGQYGAALEEYRRQALQSVGTTQYAPPQAPQMPQGLEVPDPDLLFSNKGAWTDEFQRSLESKLGSVRGESAQMVQGAVAAFQQEFQRRDQADLARKTHDAAMEQMLEQRGLQDHTRIVQAIYNEQYQNLQNLPLNLAFDRIGAMAQEEIDRIRSGEQWTVVPNAKSSVAPRPPAMLRSVKKAPAAPLTAPQTPEYDPNGNIGTMGKIIRKRQAAMLRATA